MLSGFKAGAFKIGTFTDSPGHVAALDRVKAWTRARFKLAEEDAVSVSQVTCAEVRLPAAGDGGGVLDRGRHSASRQDSQPVAEVVEDDLPPSWMKGALAATRMEGWRSAEPPTALAGSSNNGSVGLRAGTGEMARRPLGSCASGGRRRRRLQRRRHRSIDLFQPDEFELIAGLLGNILEVPPIARRQHHALRSPARCAATIFPRPRPEARGRAG